ncbi:MAG: hypothetical protein ACXVRJ_06590 [Gaiellaceae bacterium]
MATSAALMLISAFAPWVNVVTVSFSGFDGGNHGWVILAAAFLGAGLLYAGRGSRSAGAYPLIAGAVAVTTAIHDRTNVGANVGAGSTLVRAVAVAGWGLNLALVASVSLGGAGIAWLAASGDLPWSWRGARQAVVGAAPPAPTAMELAARDNERRDTA